MMIIKDNNYTHDILQDKSSFFVEKDDRENQHFANLLVESNKQLLHHQIKAKEEIINIDSPEQIQHQESFYFSSGYHDKEILGLLNAPVSRVKDSYPDVQVAVSSNYQATALKLFHVLPDLKIGEEYKILITKPAIAETISSENISFNNDIHTIYSPPIKLEDLRSARQHIASLIDNTSNENNMFQNEIMKNFLPEKLQSKNELFLQDNNNLVMNTDINSKERISERFEQKYNNLEDNNSVLELDHIKIKDSETKNYIIYTAKLVSNQKLVDNELMESNQTFEYLLSMKKKSDMIINSDMLSSEEGFFAENFDQKDNRNSILKKESLNSQDIIVFDKETMGHKNWDSIDDIDFSQKAEDIQDHNSINNLQRDQKSILLQIKSSGLDDILVRVRLIKNEITASFIVKSNEAHALLRSNLTALSEALLDIGLPKQHISYHVSSHDTSLEQSAQFTSSYNPNAWANHEGRSQDAEGQGENEEEIFFIKAYQNNLIDIII